MCTKKVLEPEWLCPADESRARLAAELAAPGAGTALDAVLRLDTHVLMPEDPVKRVDNMTMAWGLEARVPFLDQDLARPLLPAAVIDRPKGYFPVPALRYLHEPFSSLVQDSLRTPAAKQRSLFRPEYIEGLLENPHHTSAPTRGNTLWPLAVLKMWLQHHLTGS